MSDERDRENEEPKIRIVDRRMLSEDERAGKGAAPASSPDESSAPKLEIIGGGRKESSETAAQSSAPLNTEAQNFGAGAEGDELGENMTEEEAQQMREQLEGEQFAAIEQQMGRPLTEQEKDAVRAEMEKRAQAITSLEVGPVLMEVLTTMPRYAYVHLGLMPNPYTQLIAKNDVQARLAIDTFAALYEVLKTQLDPRSRKELENVLADLKANFVSVTGSNVGEPSGPRIIH